MSVHRGNIYSVINDAWYQAVQVAKRRENGQHSAQVRNTARSRMWIDALAWAFQGEYSNGDKASLGEFERFLRDLCADSRYPSSCETNKKCMKHGECQKVLACRKSSYRIFWRGNGANKKHFSVKELLYDLTVCSVKDMRSFQRLPNDLEFVDKCYWQVESEFHPSDFRQILIDMSKLVMGGAENKLFVAAHRRANQLHTNSDVLEKCRALADSCTGRVYFAFVSHPECWVNCEDANEPTKPSLYEWLAGNWQEVAASSDDCSN